MKQTRIYVVVAVALALFGGAAFLPAQDAPTQPALPQEMVKAYVEAGKPTQKHEIFKKLAGNFDAAVKEFYDPTAPAVESKGSSVNQIMFDGRYLHCMFKGTMMGIPFEGVDVVGYDTVNNRYTCVWMDNMSTQSMVAYGQGDDTTITLKGEMVEPMTKQKVPMTLKTVVESADKHTFTITQPGPDGKEFTCLEIVYTRVK